MNYCINCGKLTIELLYDLAILLLGACPREVRVVHGGYACTPVLSAALLTKTWCEGKMNVPHRMNRANAMCNMYTTGYCAAAEEGVILALVVGWANV